MNLDKEIINQAENLAADMVKYRRDLHKHPEAGWTEFRTASIVIKKLQKLGYEVYMGSQVINVAEQMGLPSQDVLNKCMEQAITEGADPKLVEKMTGGLTGVVGIMNFAKPGKTVALRFDMDCNEVNEANDDEHRPYREGFSSIHTGLMHACGHDGHTSVGLAIAEIMANLKDKLCGKIKLIFQPAEEGVRGARAMAAAGVVDDVDYLLGAHLMMPKVGTLAYDVRGFLATTKFNADFTGVPAHAGSNPEIGRNAMLAAATAAINIQAIPRHSGGSSRINVGVLNAGTGRNVVPANAHLEIETRGATTAINEYIYQRAESILQGAAAMQDVSVKIIKTGSAASGSNTLELSNRIKQIAERLGTFDKLEEMHNIGGSEDCAYFMERVQERGGQAAYLVIGGSLTAINHNSRFDFDEKALILDTEIMTAATCDLLEG